MKCALFSPGHTSDSSFSVNWKINFGMPHPGAVNAR